MKAKGAESVPSYTKKGFPAALDHFFAQNVPQLGGSLTRKAVVEEIEKMVEKYYPATERLKMGQMIWYAVDEKEKAGYGKTLESCEQRPVILDVLHKTDIEALLQGLKKTERQKRVIARLFCQAYEQGGVLTHADVGSILRLSAATISRYVKRYEKETDRILPRRGTIHDMGPTLTHKRIICKKHFFEGKTVEQTARETYHSPQAVVRYTNDFKRVRECLKAGWAVEKISYTTGLSKSLTEEYVQMIEHTSSCGGSSQGEISRVSGYHPF